ncbi:nucleoside-diphosphate kinase [Metallumcola ferriviriculae]|uniref:Nucleoside diphosphate kinase n=1 Tax=Metallumcola ferriviriculae TaxID=3039180 RepID=A0AAU0UMK6_9FIRM|nr:nucleoside-diphosphate kinase [Desulfitibacteraceae bacterium MK1]
MEQTYVMIKPDGVQRNLVGDVIGRFEKKGYKLVAIKLLLLTEEQAKEHYREHVGKPFFPGLLGYITSGPVVAMVWAGKDVVSAARKMMGKTNPLEAEPGTIRGDYGLDIGRNVIHGADSVESAQREIAIYFKEDESTSYEKTIEEWQYE